MPETLGLNPEIWYCRGGHSLPAPPSPVGFSPCSRSFGLVHRSRPTNGSRPPFFWIHGELSDATLPRHLGPDQPVYGLLHQSDDGKPARYKTVESIAAHYLSEIRTIQPKGPYFIGGFCFGGLVAIEIAQQLRAVGDEMAFLVVMDTRHSQNMWTVTSTSSESTRRCQQGNTSSRQPPPSSSKVGRLRYAAAADLSWE